MGSLDVYNQMLIVLGRSLFTTFKSYLDQLYSNNVLNKCVLSLCKCIHTMPSVCRIRSAELDDGFSFWLPVSKRCQPNGDPSLFGVAGKLPCHRSNGVPRRREEPSRRDAGV